jgi:hypothetical protein
MNVLIRVSLRQRRLDVDKVVDDLSPFSIPSEARLKNTRETRNKEGIDLLFTE